MRTILTLAATGVAAASASLASDNVDLRISRVAVFSSGVAYFEHDAAVTENATAELSFRTDQINDILKSLIVQDLDGGSVGVVSYASRDPIEKTLRSFGVDITGKPSLAQLLDQLRGEPVEITGAKALKGVILGVEKQKAVVGQEVVEYDVVNVLTDEGLKQLRITDLAGVKLANEKVESELRKALATLALGHSADKKSVSLSFNGQGQRRVRVAYLLEAPIWKTSYRLALSKEKAPYLQGWATVENATEEDWNNVRLSLVSGRPISFVMDLYTPLYVPRPREELELYASLRPPEFEGGMRERTAAMAEAMQMRAKSAEAPPGAKPAAPARGQGGGQSLFQGGREGDDDDRNDANAGIELEQAGVESVARADEAGELFVYDIRVPVSISRRNSAMLPIVNQEITAEKMSIYNPTAHDKYPLNGLLITNKTGLHLMQGPMTVFDESLYAGDAKLPDLKPDEKRLVAYALDLSTEVVVTNKPGAGQLLALKISKGVLTQKRKLVDEREYAIRSKADRDRTLLIEQLGNVDWTLLEPKEPYEKTKSLWRFKVDLPAGKTVSQVVKMEREMDSHVSVGNLDDDALTLLMRNAVASDALQRALQRVIQLRAALAEAGRRRGQIEQQMQEATTEQARVRENIKVLEKSTDSYQRQLKKLDDLETQLEKLRGDLAAARADEEKKRAELADYIAQLDVG